MDFLSSNVCENCKWRSSEGLCKNALNHRDMCAEVENADIGLTVEDMSDTVYVGELCSCRYFEDEEA